MWLNLPMQIHHDDSTGKYKINRYEPGLIEINQQDYQCNLIITPNQLLTDWRPGSFADLEIEDFTSIAQLKLELVLIGTGEHQHFPPPSLLQILYQAQIGVECMTTAAACRTFNLLLAEGRNVAAALFVR